MTRNHTLFSNKTSLFSQLTCPVYKVLKQFPQKIYGVLVN